MVSPGRLAYLFNHAREGGRVGPTHPVDTAMASLIMTGLTGLILEFISLIAAAQKYRSQRSKRTPSKRRTARGAVPGSHRL